MRKVLKSLQAAFFRTSQKPSEFLRSRRNSARVKGVKTFELKLELTERAEIYRKVLPCAENVVLGAGEGTVFLFCGIRGCLYLRYYTTFSSACKGRREKHEKSVRRMTKFSHRLLIKGRICGIVYDDNFCERKHTYELQQENNRGYRRIR